MFRYLVNECLAVKRYEFTEDALNPYPTFSGYTTVLAHNPDASARCECLHQTDYRTAHLISRGGQGWLEQLVDPLDLTGWGSSWTYIIQVSPED